MTYAETSINTAGLMRCCIATIQDFVEEHMTDEAPGAMLMDCKYEPEGNESIFLCDMTWRWNDRQP